MNPVFLFVAVAVATALAGGSEGPGAAESGSGAPNAKESSSEAPGAKGRGEAIFTGKESLKGAIRGHRSGLPPEAVRCSNCHAVRDQKGPPSPAPAISRALLLDKVQRRGGPPSSYDPASFCKMLRSGIDPAYIVISRVMPIYEVDDAQCGSLWDFFTGGSVH